MARDVCFPALQASFDTFENDSSTVEVVGRTVEVIGCTEVGAADGFVDATGVTFLTYAVPIVAARIPTT